MGEFLVGRDVVVVEELLSLEDPIHSIWAIKGTELQLWWFGKRIVVMKMVLWGWYWWAGWGLLWDSVYTVVKVFKGRRIKLMP